MCQFSVIIPLYNKENFIKKSIESVLNQIFTDFEIIVVDDGSTDSSLVQLEKITSSKLKLIKHCQNKGLSECRNTGIENATGEFIAFLDADDQWKENFLSEISSLIKQFPRAKIFATNYEEIISNKHTILPSNRINNLPERSQITNYFEASIGQPLYCYSSVCFEKSVFEKIGFFNKALTFAEDIDFNIRANLNFKLAYSKKALAQYFIFSENQITQTSVESKKLIDLDLYQHIDNPALIKYLDFHRYIFAKMYKLEGNFEKYRKVKKNIKLSNLNHTQKILIFAPKFLLQFIKTIKTYCLNKGLRFTTYG